VETGRTVADALGIPVSFDARLREAHLGDAQGLTWSEIHDRFGVEIAGRWRSSAPTDADVSYPGGETGAQVMRRALDAIRAFLEGSSFERVGVSTHGGVIRRVMQHVRPPGSAPVPIPNGVIYDLSYDLETGLFRLESEVPDAPPSD
jgi:broad specificity phosphatase PhoE